MGYNIRFYNAECCDCHERVQIITTALSQETCPKCCAEGTLQEIIQRK